MTSDRGDEFCTDIKTLHRITLFLFNMFKAQFRMRIFFSSLLAVLIADSNIVVPFRLILHKTIRCRYACAKSIQLVAAAAAAAAVVVVVVVVVVSSSEPGSSVSRVIRLQAGRPGFEYRQG
jgi:hypothetical protein